jgi:hypothetical protein
MINAIKKEYVMALVLLLAIPAVMMVCGAVFSLINPEIAWHTKHYHFYWTLINTIKIGVMWGMATIVVVLWLLVCLQVIRGKKQSTSWLVLAALGPIGLAILAMLKDRASASGDPYSRFVDKLHWTVRAGYELVTFWAFWELAYRIMLLKSNVMIHLEAARTGMSIAQVIDLHNASGGMWAFSEMLETMFFMVVLYLLRPVVFNLVARLAAPTALSKPS